MSRLIPFGHMANNTDEHEYEGNVSRRRNHRCQCDSGLTHGTCPGPENCPNSDRAEEDEIMFLCSTRNTVVDPEPCRYCGITLADPCEDPPVDICPKAIAS